MKLFLNIFLLILSVLLTSCSILTEEDLSNKEVIINIPINGTESSRQSQTFWWEEIDGSIKYNLQIFLIKSDQVEEIIADTNLVQNRFTISLNPGEYNWRIRGWNNYSSTDFYSQNLTIIESPSLENQEVVLITPAEFIFKKDTIILFKWYPLSMAQDYVLEIRNDSWQGSLVYPRIITSYDTITIKLLDGNYQWGVKAQNEISTSEFSVRTLGIDTKTPPEPIPVIPIDSAIFTSKSVNLTWSHSSPEDANFLIDSLIVSTDSLFQSSGIILTKGVSNKTYSKDFETNGKYFWRVKSMDRAGNYSEWSSVRSFFIEL